MGDELATTADRIAFLRARGVEVDLPEERGLARLPAAQSSGGAEFTFVRIPADIHEPVSVERARDGVGDVLPAHLRPRFADEATMDDEVVRRETAARLKNMLQAGGDDVLKAPSAGAMQALAAGGACEAYPLAQASDENGGRAVRLYIDEVGALRARPRNKRAEDLAAAAGLSALSIYGDAFIGRCERAAVAGEVNAHFRLEELAHDSEWVLSARRTHMATAQRNGHGSDEHLASGEHGVYRWTQTEEEVEVRVRAAPEGRGAGKRVAVEFGRGASLSVAFDGKPVLALEPLFARVSPDGSSWSLEDGELVVTLSKMEARPWAMLVLQA